MFTLTHSFPSLSLSLSVEGLGYELGSLHTASWVVTGLPQGSWVTFRVRVSNCSAYAGYSAAAQPFKVGCMCYSPVGSGVGGDTWTPEEMALFQELDTPMKVQDYLDSIPMNQEVDADVSLSALECVRQNHGHCLEGAILGAYILGLHGYGTQLMDLRSSPQDDDHVVTPFQWKGRWGCLSVSNHSSLRYRNPVYLTLREMVMSYFDDYMNGQGARTLRAYSKPFDLARLADGGAWCYARGHEGSRELARRLDKLPHFRLFPNRELKTGLRPADVFMLKTTVPLCLWMHLRDTHTHTHTHTQVDQREWHYPKNADEEAQIRNKNR